MRGRYKQRRQQRELQKPIICRACPHAVDRHPLGRHVIELGKPTDCLDCDAITAELYGTRLVVPSPPQEAKE